MTVLLLITVARDRFVTCGSGKGVGWGCLERLGRWGRGRGILRCDDGGGSRGDGEGRGGRFDRRLLLRRGFL